jgi:hypothetical protein
MFCQRTIIEVPVCGDFDESGLVSAAERLHPVSWRFAVVDRSPGVLVT